MSGNIVNHNIKYPPHWDVLPFSEAIEDVTGGNPKIKQGEYKSSGLLAVVDQGQELIGGYINDETKACKEKLPCILFGDHTKIFKFVEKPFALGADGVKVLSPLGDYDKRFVYHYLNTVKLPDDAGYSRHFKFLKETYIPKPPIDEQKRIAAILDKADAIRRKRQQAIKLADDFLRATFLDMFGDPITNPKGWPVFPLEKVGKVSTGTTPSSEKAGMFGGNIPFITPGDLENGDDKIKRFVTEEGSRNSRTVRKGSTLVCCIGATIGKIGIAQERSAFNQQINAIEWNDVVNDLYGFGAMSFLKDLVINRAIKTTLPILKKSEFEKINIPLPPHAIQAKYAKIFQHNSIMKVKKKSLNNYSNILLNSLTQRAFRGEI